MIKSSRFSLKTELRACPRVSASIFLQNEINRQMSGAIKTAERNANEAASKRGITVSKFVRSAVVKRTAESPPLWQRVLKVLQPQRKSTPIRRSGRLTR
jgi:hypothetical protein